MDEVFKALAAASRRRLLDQLRRRNGQSLGDLLEGLAMTRQAVSKHLAILEAANLVATVWRGREKLHYFNPVPLHEIYARWISKYERHRLAALDELKKELEETTPWTSQNSFTSPSFAPRRKNSGRRSSTRNSPAASGPAPGRIAPGKKAPHGN